MKHFLFALFVCSAASVFAQEPLVKPLHDPKMSYFSLGDVQLTDSEFKHLQEMTHRYLLTLEPDKLCSWFRREAGLTPKAQPYPFWESENPWGGGPLPGHILGFYLSSMAMMYETTSDPEIVKRFEYILTELEECQNAGEDGYLSACVNGRHVFEDVVEGKFRKLDGGMLNENWEPVYIMNKIMLGLHDVHITCQLPKAKQILVKMADWFGTAVVDKMDDERLQKMLVCEHGSIAESYIQVYELTGGKKYLEWAKRLNDQRMLVPASEGKDILAGWHANTQIPKFTAFENVFRYTGEKKYSDAAHFFWKTVVADHTWNIGANSTGEHFFPKTEYDERVMRTGGPESCNSVNMLRLTEALYQDDPQPQMLDYYERVLVNHIASIYEPERGMCVYYTTMRPGGYKIHGTEHDSFWCCTGTGFESPAKFQKMIYTHNTDSLFVNLFIPSVVQWKEKGITLKQETKIPNEERTVLTLGLAQPAQFTLKVRHPAWVEKGQLNISINGEKQTVSSESSQFIELNRTWKNGDKVEVELPMKLSAAPLTESNKFFSFAYGPVVLAAEFDSSDMKKTDYWHARQTTVRQHLPLEKIPGLKGTASEIAARTKKVSANPLTFKIDDYTLIPFNRIHYSRYVIYFPAYHNENDDIAKVEEPKGETVDRVLIANAESEKLHKMEYVSSQTGTNYGRSWRDAPNGGYFMYEMKCLPDKPQELYFVFNGPDSGKRTFDVQIDGKTIATIDHSKPVGAGLYSVTVPIPAELTKGKTAMTVKLQAKRENTAGGIFDLRVVAQ